MHLKACGSDGNVIFMNVSAEQKCIVRLAQVLFIIGRIGETVCEATKKRKAAGGMTAELADGLVMLPTDFQCKSHLGLAPRTP